MGCLLSTFLSCIWAVPLLGFADRSDVETEPGYLVIMLAGESSRIVEQGSLSDSTYRRQFLDEYAMGGERHHPPEGAILAGLLIAHDATSVTVVPIRTWKRPDGLLTFLCQSSEHGDPPMFSAYAHSEKKLLIAIEKVLLDEGSQERTAADTADN